jgi:hypothetical protein
MGGGLFKAEESSSRSRDVLTDTEKREKLGRRRIGEMKDRLLMRGSTATDNVEHSRLEGDVIEGKKREKVLAKGVSNRKFSDEGSHDHVEAVIITSDGEFRKESEGVTDAAGGSKIVAAEERIILHDCFKLEVKIWLNLIPGRIRRRGRNDSGVVARNKDGVRRGKGVAKTNDGEVVVGVVIIGTGFASETHTGERTELSGDIGLEEDVKIDEMGRNGESEHLETLKKDGLAMLGLVKGGVIVGERSLRVKSRLAKGRKLGRRR